MSAVARSLREAQSGDRRERPRVMRLRDERHRQPEWNQRRCAEPEYGGRDCLGRAEVTDGDGGAGGTYHCPERDQPPVGADVAAAGLDDHEHAEEADEHRSPAPAPGRLAQHRRRQQGREDWNRETDRRRFGQRQQRHHQEIEQHGDDADRHSHRMGAEAPGPKRGEARSNRDKHRGAHNEPIWR